ncbi:MAG TPA: class I SAM-dependent methyltransferase [Dermatophilaceae bacterium]|nr:class I SAM-dependent methyltransferase [Dermatophilaceae bacterium]
MRIFRGAVRRLPVRVELPDGSQLGAGGTGDPVMALHRPADFAARVGRAGLIGFGESYMAGDWDADDLGGLLAVFAARIDRLVPRPLQALRAGFTSRHPHSERNTADNTRSNIARHYDLSNDLFRVFLDESLTYSSALFQSDWAPEPQHRGGMPVARAGEPAPLPGWDALAGAQRNKIDRLLDQAGVCAGSRVLEIGSGWGELAIRAARRGASVRTITLSSEQLTLARRRVAEAGLADRVEVQLLDYRMVDGEYDAVVSVEMVEAVGHEYLDAYLATIERCLAPGGRVAIQAITMPHRRMLATRNTYTWVHKYIFPGGLVPSVEAISRAAARAGLEVASRSAFGRHYAHTLRLWDERFTAQCGQVAALGFDEVFRRMWHFYLEYSRAGFASGYLDVQQIAFTRRESA